MATEVTDAEFASLVDPHRAGLFAHCYRMLGSPQDAEDALQEALLRAWRGLEGFEQRSSLKNWLYTIATNTSLRAMERRRVLPIDFGPAADPHDNPDPPLAESVWVEPVPDSAVEYERRESVELAFIAALQLLPARQRAALILHEVVGFSAAEIGAMLETTPASVYSALQRARATLADRLPAQSQQTALAALDDAALQAIVDGYVAAWEQGDMDALAALLTDDAEFSMPPYAIWFRGRDAVMGFLERRPLANGRRWPSVRIAANGQLAFAHWGDGRAHSVCLLTLRGGQISEMTSFLVPSLFARFGLPDEA